MDPSLKASYYSHISEEELEKGSSIAIVPPYEPKDKVMPWVRGALKLHDDSYIYHTMKDLVVTGPKFRICYSGCKWNRMCLEIGPREQEFVHWLGVLASVVQRGIWAYPEKYKPGAKNNSRFIFDTDFIKPSSDPSRYPDELRCRLSTAKRLMNVPTDDSTYEDIVDANLFTIVDGEEVPVDPASIQSGWMIVPVFKLSYYRNLERFGLVITIIKGHVFPVERGPSGPANFEWSIDYQSEMDISN
jgi:hypothetical protein